MIFLLFLKRVLFQISHTDSMNDERMGTFYDFYFFGN